MAAKKAIAGMDTVDMPEVEVAAPKKTANASDPFKKTVTIRLPKKEDGSPNYVIASVNGRVYKIKRGEAVDVPAPVAEVIQHSFDAEEAAELYMESKAD